MSAHRQTRLYEADSYVTECRARVLEVRGLRVILDRSPLVPGYAGMECDLGWIDGVRVTDGVFLDDGSVAAYGVERPSAYRRGDDVHVCVDHQRRIGLLKNATAADLVVAALTVGRDRPDVADVEIAECGSRVTFDHPAAVHLRDLARTINGVIAQALPVRLGPSGPGHRRLCRIPGLPLLVGYGPRVAKTSEVGAVLLSAVPHASMALGIDCSVRRDVALGV